MEINFVKPKKGWQKLLFFEWLSETLLVEIIVYGLLLAIFYFVYMDEGASVGLTEINVLINGLTYNYYLVIPLFVLVLYSLNMFVEVGFRYRCEVCSKYDYLRNMVPVSKEDAVRLKNDLLGRVVCKVHKKPYLKEIK